MLPLAHFFLIYNFPVSNFRSLFTFYLARSTSRYEIVPKLSKPRRLLRRNWYNVFVCFVLAILWWPWLHKTLFQVWLSFPVFRYLWCVDVILGIPIYLHIECKMCVSRCFLTVAGQYFMLMLANSVTYPRPYSCKILLLV